MHRHGIGQRIGSINEASCAAVSDRSIGGAPLARDNGAFCLSAQPGRTYAPGVSEHSGRNAQELVAAGVGADEARAALSVCAGSADPEAAAAGLGRWVRAWTERYRRPPPLPPRWMERLVPVLAGSRYLLREVCRRPRLAAHLAATPFFEVAKPRHRL